MQTIMAISVVAPIWWALTMDGPPISRRLCITASLLSVISFVVTRFGNVPINRMIKTWFAAAPTADYGRLLDRWMAFNALRTATAALGFVCKVWPACVRQVKSEFRISVQGIFEQRRISEARACIAATRIKCHPGGIVPVCNETGISNSSVRARYGAYLGSSRVSPAY